MNKARHSTHQNVPNPGQEAPSSQTIFRKSRGWWQEGNMMITSELFKKSWKVRGTLPSGLSEDRPGKPRAVQECIPW